ncbi:hypothetical protein H6F61_11025 [Cyanobacteria bacterium FACHB-472]|nr:hypothetical protein [Cyanobacteria bacterium FACHB-472]
MGGDIIGCAVATTSDRSKSALSSGVGGLSRSYLFGGFVGSGKRSSNQISPLLETWHYVAEFEKIAPQKVETREAITYLLG